MEKEEKLAAANKERLWPKGQSEEKHESSSDKTHPDETRAQERERYNTQPGRIDEKLARVDTIESGTRDSEVKGEANEGSGNGRSQRTLQDSDESAEVVGEPTEQQELGGTTRQQIARIDEDDTGLAVGGITRDPRI
jgi:hypothetical protein